jgi:DMSO/TMAO reductase YedYZ molybdopterin-dependent catalytic subunit
MPACGIDTLYRGADEPLLPDHGHPVRLVVPHWIGVSSIKWVGRIEASDQPLFSPWNTQFYRLFGPGYPDDGQPFDKQVVASPAQAASSRDRSPTAARQPRPAGPRCAAGRLPHRV